MHVCGVWVWGSILSMHVCVWCVGMRGVCVVCVVWVCVWGSILSILSMHVCVCVL